MATESRGGRRPARADAVRNRAALLDAALRLFADRGGDVGIQDVAAAAGVAVGTVYRHWPTKRALLQEVVHARLEEVADTAETAVDLAAFLDAVTDFCVRDRPFVRLLDEHSLDAGPEAPGGHGVRDRLDRAVGRLIERAAAAGSLRNPLRPRDLRIYLIGVRAALAGDDADAWRRHHAIYRAGLMREDASPGVRAPVPGSGR